MKSAKLYRMQLRLALSFLFVLSTLFVVVHETEHIVHDEPTCLICHINDNLGSADPVVFTHTPSLICCKEIISKQNHLPLFNQKATDQNRAPPSLS